MQRSTALPATYCDDHLNVRSFCSLIPPSVLGGLIDATVFPQS
jgi:hypothetical protein